ncbi:hypothetical protein N7451_001551 [Penicillium sp. IBT 35674x]|nr:hypothetical protein N7451_001551 [Penicillium sp. IBT 35674x]
MNSTPEQILDIEDALVSDENPPRYDGTLDYERCARLHNYLVAYGWMARHGKDTHDLDALAREKWFWREPEENLQAIRERLIPSLNSFLDLIYDPEPRFFYWVGGLDMRLCDESLSYEDIPYEDGELQGKERFVVIYGTAPEFGPHCLGVIYDQQLHRASFPMTRLNWESIDPMDGHEELWYPLETILSHWIYMIRLGRVVPGLPDDYSTNRSQIGLWSWLPYCDAQVDSTVAAMEHYSAIVESRMPPSSQLPLPGFTPFFTNADLDAAAVPQDCFIRSLLTRVKTPRFKFIAPGLEVPHDKEAFAARQQFTNMPYEEGSIPAVLLFTASRTVNLNTEVRWLFNQAYEDGEISMSDGDPVSAGLYSEPVRRDDYDMEEAGFRLLLPFALRQYDHHEEGARMSDGSVVRPGSFTQLFQHGFHPFGGEWRSQRLERLFKRWTELIESGVWTVGADGVEGSIDKFKDADNGNNTWRDYWIAPDW